MRYIDCRSARAVAIAVYCEWEDHEWKDQDNGYYRCTKCEFEKTPMEIDWMDAKRKG